MTEITAQMVKDLRESTSAGMLDCKKALTETNGDMEAPLTGCAKKAWLRLPKRPAALRPKVWLRLPLTATKAPLSK